MAGSPRFKIYPAHHGYEASAKHAEVAAMIAACLGEGSTVRDGHAKRNIVWREGSEAFSASESYDGAAEVMHHRMNGEPQRAEAVAATYAHPYA